uniref:Putative trypsin-like serine protease n=2 Tax=Ixodes ricinus TaxID=34613 RepID=V5IC37_IXORI
MVEMRGAADGEFLCGATIISSQWLLTAAHCLRAGKDDGYRKKSVNEFQLRLGLTDRKNTSHEQEVFIEEIIRHKDYIEATNQNDIALLRLNQTITFNEFARPICLPPSHDRLSQRLPFYNANQTAFVIGWGAERKGRSDVLRLKQLKLRIQRQESCRKAFENFTYDGSMMCAKYAEAKGDACEGDSGGPLMQGVVDDETVWTQVGIVSWGIHCDGRKPGVYTNVARYVPWIEEVMSRARNVSDAAQPPLPGTADSKA